MKFDLEQVFLFGLFDVLALFAVQLEILAHFVSPGTHPTPASFGCHLVIVICVLRCPPAGNYRNQRRDQQRSKPSQTWLQFWYFLNLEFPLEICPNRDLHFLDDYWPWAFFHIPFAVFRKSLFRSFAHFGRIICFFPIELYEFFIYFGY